MIECTKQLDGTFTVTGLTVSELVEIETAMSEMFNKANRQAHKSYRGQLRHIISTISDALDLHEKRQQCAGLKLNF